MQEQCKQEHIIIKNSRREGEGVRIAHAFDKNSKRACVTKNRYSRMTVQKFNLCTCTRQTCMHLVPGWLAWIKEDRKDGHHTRPQDSEEASDCSMLVHAYYQEYTIEREREGECPTLAQCLVQLLYEFIYTKVNIHNVWYLTVGTADATHAQSQSCTVQYIGKQYQEVYNIRGVSLRFVYGNVYMHRACVNGA